MAQMILYLCRDTNLKVMSILSEISKKEDVTEFITTIQLVQITINALIKSQKVFKFDLLKDLQYSLKDYETLLVQLVSEQPRKQTTLQLREEPELLVMFASECTLFALRIVMAISHIV